jgi:hypothetical protein
MPAGLPEFEADGLTETMSNFSVPGAASMVVLVFCS